MDRQTDVLTLREVNWWYFHLRKAQAASSCSRSVHFTSATHNKIMAYYVTPHSLP